MSNGVNTAKSNATRVKVGDTGSTIVITLENTEKNRVQDIQWIRAYSSATPNPTQYVDIPDYHVEDGSIHLQLPEITRGEYNIELKDEDGRIYPAEGQIKLSMISSTKDAGEVYYVTYRELILEDVTPLIEDFLSENPDGFKGDKGDTTAAPPKVFTRAEYDDLPTKELDTLYIVKEVE